MITPELDVDSLWSRMRPDGHGLVTTVVQDVRSRRVLMVAWVSRTALEETLRTGLATFWSRSRKELWQKGATSGHTQRVLHVRLDCDGDTLLYLVEPKGPACHEGYAACFSWRRVGNGWRRDPEPDEPPPGRVDGSAALRSDLGQQLAGDAPGREDSARRGPRPEQAIRVGAAIEQRARAVANALQLRQPTVAKEAVGQLLDAVARALDEAGVDRLEAARFDDGTERSAADPRPRASMTAGPPVPAPPEAAPDAPAPEWAD